MASEKNPTSKGQAWFCTTGLPSDVVIEVEDMSFHLHKFPLMSKSKKLDELITEQETNHARVQRISDSGEDVADAQEIEEEEEDQFCRISFPDFPGGSEAFEASAKFCYGVKLHLSSSNVAALRCAGEFLEMTEEYSEDNLIARTETFLSQSVLKSLKESIRTLNSCQRLMPLGETLAIVERCIDAIAARASSADPSSLFGWPVSDVGKEGKGPANQAMLQAVDTGARRKSAFRAHGAESWMEELGSLSLPLFKRLICAMKARDLSPDVIESCLVYYGKKHIPGISRSSRKPSSSSIPSEEEQRELLDTIIRNLPAEKSSASSTVIRFLFGLLRTANILNASEECRASLEKKIGSQLEQATLDDLLIPSYSYLNETLYDVDCIERILGFFLARIEETPVNTIEGRTEDTAVRSTALMLVGKLIDGYLSEIASDPNLKPDRFIKLAVSLPEHARLFDDGLYRAVDVFLKAHPWMSEAERERLCGTIDCQKLTLEACTHAAQNERLPLRAVVQVLFFEQVQLRQAIAGTLIAADGAVAEASMPTNEGREQEDEEEAREREGSSTWRATVRENQVLRLDMDSMRTRVHALERECSAMKKAIEKIDKVGRNGGTGAGGGGWRTSLTKKFGCKFKTQVCDSHQQTVVEARKGRSHHRHQ